MKNIVLIGMSGVGKTQKGRYIARKMDRLFIDTDAAIVESQGLSIDHIFDQFGEDYFRNIEDGIINRVSELQNMVISTGGGVILRHHNMINLKGNGFIVYLKAEVPTIINNLNKSKTIRPLLKDSPDLYKSVDQLYKFREYLYRAYSDLIIDIEDKSKKDIYNEVLKAYKEYITCGK